MHPDNLSNLDLDRRIMLLMENYKKKPLKFVGMGKDVRVATLTTARSSSRHQKFSLQRPTNDVEGSQENIPSSSGIPILGNKKSQSSRAEMLKKWKEEKLLKKKIELQSKKPAFKAGFVTQPICSSALYKSDDSSRIPKCHSSEKDPSLLGKTCMKSKESDGKFTTKSQAAGTKPRSNISSIKPKVPVMARPIPREIVSKDSNSSSKLKPPKVETTNVKGSKKTQPSQLPTFKSSYSVPVKQIEQISRKPVGNSKLRKELPKKETNIVPESNNRCSKFACQLSSIEPVNTSTSFAPDEFVFTTPITKFKSLLNWTESDNPLKSLQESGDQRKTSTPKKPELKNYKEQASGCFQDTQSTKECSVKSNEESLGNVPSSETKHILSLLDNSSSDITLLMQSSLQNVQSEQNPFLEIPSQKENIKVILSEIDSLQIHPSEQLSFKTVSIKAIHPQVSVNDTVKPEQSGVSEVMDFKIPAEPKGIEELSSSGMPAQKETVKDSSILLKKSPAAAPDLCFLEKEQEKVMASEPRLLENNPERNAASGVSLPDQPEVGSISDSVFLTPSIHDGTKGKREALNENPALQKIGKGQETGETPRGAGRCIVARRQVIAGEFTPRRSLRLARLTRIQSEDNLFDVEEPSFMGSEESSRLTEDFGRLNLESGDASQRPQPRRSTRPSTSRAAEVSLLYTPPRTRASTRVKSLGEDLMSFSPYV